MNPTPLASRCVVPGSYDPVTYGHLDVIARASALYEEVIVAVVNISVRKSTPLFSADERCKFLEDATAHHGNVRAQPFDTLIVEFARKVGAKAIVKGLRAISDFEYEMEMAQLNRMQEPEIESVYLMSAARHSFLSSSGVKELATFGGRIDELVPPAVEAALKDKLLRERT